MGSKSIQNLYKFLRWFKSSFLMRF